MKKTFLLLIVVLPLLYLLFFGLSRNPLVLPSALVGKTAPLFELEDLHGTKVRLRNLLGKPVLINFWSTWCSSCAMEHRLLEEASKNYAPEVQFFSLLYDDTAENAKRFVRVYGESISILLDPHLKTAIDYGVAGVPETFLIDRQGRIAYKHVGALTADVLAEKIPELIATTP